MENGRGKLKKKKAKKNQSRERIFESQTFQKVKRKKNRENCHQRNKTMTQRTYISRLKGSTES